MIKKSLFFTLSFLIISFTNYAGEPVSSDQLSSPSEANSSDDMRRMNSLIEAFMAGKIKAAESQVDGTSITYPDYADASITHSESLEQAHNKLKECYNIAWFKISGWEPFPIQMKLLTLKREEKLEYLHSLSEFDKLQLQVIRLYDFLSNQNYGLPKATQAQLKPIVEDTQLTKEQIIERLKKVLGEDFEARLSTIEANRKALAVAMKEGVAQAVNAACSKPLHLMKFISMRKAIRGMIVDIKQDKENDNVFINNYSRR